MVEVSKNLGMGSAAIGLTGAGIGIGLVFAALLQAVARNPALRGQLFSYAILGFAFVEAIGLFDLMVALMAKFVCRPRRRPRFACMCATNAPVRPKLFPTRLGKLLPHDGAVISEGRARPCFGWGLGGYPSRHRPPACTIDGGSAS